MKALLAVCLCLLSAGAFADGIPLFTPGPSIAASDPIRQIPETKQAGFVRMLPVVLNDAAFGADVVTVEMNGKVHTFAMRRDSHGAASVQRERPRRPDGRSSKSHET
jgi:hypothetical protein